MKVTKENMDKTLQLILSDEIIEENTKNVVKELFSSNDEKKINEKILKNIIFFCRFPIVKDIYLDDEYIDACIQCFDNYNNFRYIIENLSSQIDIKLFLNTDKIVNKLLESDTLVDFIAYMNLFDLYDEPQRGRLVTKYLEIENIDIHVLSRIPNEYQDEILKNDKIKNDIYNYLIESTISISLNENLEYKLWNLFKYDFKKLPLTKRVDIFSSLSLDDLKKEAIELFELVDELDNIYSFNRSKITKYIDQDKLVEKCLKINDPYDLSSYVSGLDKEHQIKLINELFQGKLNYFKDNLFFSSFDIELQEKLFDILQDILGNDNIYGLYKKTKNIKYLEKLKQKCLEDEKLYIKDYFYEDEFVKLLSDKEKEIIISKIEVSGHIVFKNRDIINYNDYFFNICFDKNVEFLNNNESSIYMGSIDFINNLNKEQQDKIINYIKLNTLIDNMLSDIKFFEYMLSYLKINPDFFKNKNFSEIKNSYISSNILPNISELFVYLNEEQMSIFFIPSILDTYEEIRNLFIKSALNNPNLVNNKMNLKYFSDQDKKNILKNVDISILNQLIDKSSSIFKEVVEERLDEYIDYCNNEFYFFVQTGIDSVYCIVDDDKRKKILDKITNVKVLEMLFLNLNNSEYNVNSYIFLDKILNNINLKKEKLNLSKYNEEQINYIFQHSSFKTLFFINFNYSNNLLRNKLMENIKNDITLLFDKDLFVCFNSFFYNLPIEDKTYIESEIDKVIAKSNLYSSYSSKLKNVNTIEKINFIYLEQNGYLASEKREIFDNLALENPFILSTLNPILLDDLLLKMGSHFLIKTSKYPLIEEKLVSLYNNKQNIELLVKISNYLINNNVNNLVYDKQISIIIEYLSSEKNNIKDFDLSSINENNIKDFVDYVLHDYTNITTVYIYGDRKIYDHIEEKYKIGINNFTEERLKKCDEEFLKCTDINEMKNIYFNKYFSMTLNEVTEFYKSYVVNYSKVLKYAENDTPIKFIELISKIISIEDEVTLKELYNSTKISYDIKDKYMIESVMQNAYYASLVNDYVNKQNGTKVNKTFKDKDGNLVTLEMTELLDNFGILVHSTCAYGQMPLLDNDYFISWNNNPNTSNHGICTSYITNSSYGTAAVTNNGVMFGFTKLNRQSVASYSPYDLATNNMGYNIVSNHVPFYTTLDDIPNYTRHTHNEFDLERRNDSIDSRFSCVQPDCIIIFEDMDENIKANSIKAYQDFKEHGIELKLIYMDRVKIANNEASKLKVMIDKYINSYNLDELAQIINLYESNICGCDFITDINKDELFMTDKVRDIINNTIEYIININDINLRNEQINKFVDIINSEQYKFDLLNDFNKKRAHKFKLNDEVLKQKIEYLKSLLSQNEVTIDKKI